MNDGNWDIRLSGRPWVGDEAFARHRLIAPSCRVEMIDGKLFWTDDERLLMLALLLENVGALRAVTVGDPQVWRDAVKALQSGQE